MTDFAVNAGAMDAVAGALEGMSHFIESTGASDITSQVADAMPNSLLTVVTVDATDKLKQARTAVSGQWETLASAIRAARAIAVEADEESAAKIRNLSQLPAIEESR
ncbi:invasin [Gordonia aurantiaca]|uniref:invasin n=1 Tax=Gordonia sp. B21 TaxID=3151852 RepID=UPI0032664279